jgi:UMF1 family MFS transporter
MGDNQYLTLPAAAYASSHRREQRAWYVYDWANSAFSTTVVSGLFGPYLTELVRVAAGPDGHVDLLGVPIDSRAVWEWLMALSVATQALAMPLVGAIADYGRLKKLLLGVMAYIGAAATVGMYWLEGDRWLLGCALFLVANLAFGTATLLYNAFLPEISGPAERDAVSSKGWALGYAGGGLLLAMNLWLFTQAPAFGLSEADAARISLGSAGVWWAVFTVVPLAVLRSRGPGKSLPAGQSYLGAGVRQLRHTLAKARRLPDTLTFLIAYLVYNDGIQTVIVFAGQFGRMELKLEYSSVLGAFLLSQAMGVVGAISFQHIAGRMGNKRAVMLALVVWTLLMVYVAAGVSTKQEFYLLVAAAGFVMGGSQALSRSIFSFLIPKGQEAEYFSLYEISDKGSSLLGPVVLASVLGATGSFRIGALAIAVFFVAGFGILAKVDVLRGAAAAGNEVPPK